MKSFIKRHFISIPLYAVIALWACLSVGPIGLLITAIPAAVVFYLEWGVRMAFGKTKRLVTDWEPGTNPSLMDIECGRWVSRKK